MQFAAVNIHEAEEIENNFWKNSHFESPYAFTLENFINKAGDIRVFVEEIKPYTELFLKADTILETGAGQGWASCVLKRIYDGKLQSDNITPPVRNCMFLTLANMR